VGGGEDFLYFCLLPICSQKVPKGFPIRFPKCFKRRSHQHLNFIAYCFGHNSSNFHVYKMLRGAKGRHIYASILGREAYIGFYLGECPMFQKY
jgi:hypothetical protein